MRVLVLQTRYASDPMLEHERDCFLAATGCPESDLHFRNVMNGMPAVEEVIVPPEFADGFDEDG